MRAGGNREEWERASHDGEDEMVVAVEGPHEERRRTGGGMRVMQRQIGVTGV